MHENFVTRIKRPIRRSISPPRSFDILSAYSFMEKENHIILNGGGVLNTGAVLYVGLFKSIAISTNCRFSSKSLDIKETLGFRLSLNQQKQI